MDTSCSAFCHRYFGIDIRRVQDWSTNLPTDSWPALRPELQLPYSTINVAGNSSVFLSNYFLRSVLVFDQICLSQVGNNFKGGLVGPVNYVAVSPDSGRNNRLKVQYSLKSFKSNYLLYTHTHTHTLPIPGCSWLPFICMSSPASALNSPDSKRMGLFTYIFHDKNW